MRAVWSVGIAAALACACNSTDSSDTLAAGAGGSAGGGRAGDGGSGAGKAGAAGGTGGAGATSGTGGQSGGGSGASGGSAGQVGGNAGSGAIGGSGGKAGSGGSDAGSSGSSDDAGSGGNAGDACSSDTPVVPAGRPREELTTEPVETTSCPSNPNDGFSPVNACGCDDLVCAPDEMCILVIHPSPSSLGGPARPYNGCFDLCESNDDCAAPEVCIENLYGLPVCALPECLTDGDCTAEPCGQCIPGYLIAHGGTVLSDPTSSYCVYEGSCDSATCSTCIQHNLGEPNPDWYSCQ